MSIACQIHEVQEWVQILSVQPINENNDFIIIHGLLREVSLTLLCLFFSDLHSLIELSFVLAIFCNQFCVHTQGVLGIKVKRMHQFLLSLNLSMRESAWCISLIEAWIGNRWKILKLEWETCEKILSLNWQNYEHFRVYTVNKY